MRAWRRQACAARTGGTGRTRAARDGGGGTSCPGARAQLCAHAPSPANAACAQQINPRPRPVGQVHGLGLVVRAGGSARAARQSSTSTPPPRASAPPPTVRALPSSHSLETGRKSRSSKRRDNRLVAPWLGPTSNLVRRKLRIPRAWPDLPEVTNQVLFDLNRHWYVMQLCNAAM